MMESRMPVDIVNKQGSTALIRAAYNNRTDVVRCLLEKGANVNKQDCVGWTALHYAILNRITDVIKILAQHGARTYIKNKFGFTPIDLARNWNCKEVVGVLQQHQVSTSYKFTNHSLMFHVAFARLKCNFLLSKCIYINKRRLLQKIIGCMFVKSIVIQTQQLQKETYRCVLRKTCSETMHQNAISIKLQMGQNRARNQVFQHFLSSLVFQISFKLDTIIFWSNV